MGKQCASSAMWMGDPRDDKRNSLTGKTTTLSCIAKDERRMSESAARVLGQRRLDILPLSLTIV